MSNNRQVEMLAFEKAMIYAGYNKPERGPYPDSGYLYQRDADRFAGWMLRAEVGAGGTAPEGHNAEVQAAPACGRRAWNDGFGVTEYQRAAG
jgi:hypothetical protein